MSIDLDELERDMAWFPAWKFHSYEGENSHGHRASLCTDVRSAHDHRCLGEVFAPSEDAVREIAQTVERVTEKLPALIAELRAARARYGALRELFDGQQCVLGQVREQLARAYEMVADVDEWAVDTKDALDVSNTSPAALEEELRRLEREHGAEVSGGKTEGEP